MNHRMLEKGLHERDCNEHTQAWQLQALNRSGYISFATTSGCTGEERPGGGCVVGKDEEGAEGEGEKGRKSEGEEAVGEEETQRVRREVQEEEIEKFKEGGKEGRRRAKKAQLRRFRTVR